MDRPVSGSHWGGIEVEPTGGAGVWVGSMPASFGANREASQPKRQYLDSPTWTRQFFVPSWVMADERA
jgi:hypothetical protein